MINAMRIEEILIDSLVKESDHMNCDKLPHNEVVFVEGVINTFVFHKKRLESYRGEIQFIVEQLAPELKDGISFLNMCQDKNGNQWGEHRNCEHLLCLAVGLEIIVYTIPKEMWQFLPGGVPVIQLRDRGLRTRIDELEIKTGKVIADSKEPVYGWGMQIKAPLTDEINVFYVSPQSCPEELRVSVDEPYFIEMTPESDGYGEWLQEEFKYRERAKKLLCVKEAFELWTCFTLEEIDNMDWTFGFVRELILKGFFTK